MSIGTPESLVATLLPPETLTRLVAALSIGLLVGLEREWRFREERTMGRAGLRTFGLIGLFGGLTQVIAPAMGAWLLGAAMVGLTVLFMSGRPAEGQKLHPDVTTDMAALVTLLLGAWAVTGQTLFATGVAVVVAVLLNLKPVLKRWVDRLTETEVHAVLRFLVISLVILPVIPNRGFGPYEALNPYVIWWTVVLISALSFVGYISVRLMGSQHGYLLTALLGGIVSSTVVTVNFSRLARNRPDTTNIFAACVAVACSVMAVRVYLLAVVLAPALGARLVWPMGLMVLMGVGLTALLWRQQQAPAESTIIGLDNPFELMPAIRFALLLAVIALLSNFLQDQFGTLGLYALAGSAGLADVDAITVITANQASTAPDQGPFITAVVLAVIANTLVKIGIAFRLGNASMGTRTGIVLTLMLVAALLGVVLQFG